MRWRLSDRQFQFRAVLMLLMAVLAVRLFVLTVIQNDVWSQASEDLSIKTVYTSAPRGEIRDSRGRLIAGNRTIAVINLVASEVEKENINTVALNLINLLESNGDRYNDDLPEDMADKTFRELRKKYDIDDSLSEKDARKIIVVRNALDELGYRSYMPAEIASDVSEKTIITLEERSHDFPGVEITYEYVRYYPEKDTACHIIGYLGKISDEQKDEYTEKGYSLTDRIGKEGIEKYYESVLKGTSGEKNVEVNARGQQVSVLNSKDPVPGRDVQLTVDLELQKTAEDALEHALEQIRTGGTFRSRYGNYRYGTAYKNAKVGAAVAVDVNTGDVLALANEPGYDPNLFAAGISYADWESLQGENPRDPLSPLPLYNVAAMTSVQPGSTFKPVTALAALDAGWDEAWKLYDDGAVKLGNRTFGCWIWNNQKGKHGLLDIRHALEVSCNYFFYDIGAGRDLFSGKKLPVDVDIYDVIDYAEKLGLGQITGIELAESAAGVPDESKTDGGWNTGDALNLSIGQGENAYTPIQMVRYIAAIANGGTLYDLTLTKSVEGLSLDDDTGAQINNTNPDAFDIVKEGMHLVTSGGSGTSKALFASFPCEVGAKTGTAQKSGKIQPPDEVEYIRSNLKKIAPGFAFSEIETEMKRLLTEESDTYTTESAAVRQAVRNITGASTKDIDAYKSDYDNFSWFVAFAPAEDPQIAVAVLLVQGGSGGYAGPVAREIIGRYMELQEEYAGGALLSDGTSTGSSSGN